MGIPAPLRRLSPSEYLAWEGEKIDRFELVDGLPYAMAGAGRLHEEVALALSALLWAHLEGRPSGVYKGDRKLQVGVDFFYPDVIVTCAEADRRSDGPVKSPTAVIEVLSRPTAAYDRGEKRERYVSLASLETYLIVDPESRAVERYDRSSSWVGRVLAPAEPLRIEAIEFSIEQIRIFKALD